MIVLTAERGEGKSTALIRWALEDPKHRVIVTTTEERARFLHGQAHRRTGGDGLYIVPARQFRTWSMGRRELRIAVDEVLDLVVDLLGAIPDLLTSPPLTISPIESTRSEGAPHE